MTHRFCIRLRDRREALELSQRALADRVGCVQSTISDWENGISQTTVESLTRWADALGFDVVLKERGQ